MPTCVEILREEEMELNALKAAKIDTPQGPVEAVTWGKGSAVIALHGAMGGYDQGILLARTTVHPQHQFIAISRPGYLGTPLSSGRTPQEQADLCAAVLDGLGLKRAAMMAISGGGPAALQFALRHPGRCSALVMISACNSKLDVPIPFRWQVMKLLARIPGAAGSMRKGILKDPEKAARRSIPQDEWRRTVLNDPEVAPLFLSLSVSVLTRMAERIAGTENDILQSRLEMNWRLEEVAVPTLVVHGTCDRVVPFEQARSFASRLPRAKLLSIEDGEHVAIFTHREMVRTKTSHFFEQHLDSMQGT